MSFPLADWIDEHEGCRHNLAISGMVGSITPPAASAAEIRAANEAELRKRLADDLRVAPSRVFLTTGASQANALVVMFLARHRRGERAGTCRVCLPEYPPLFDSAREAGYRLTEDPGPTEFAVVSQPRNPEGDAWDRARLLDWASGARWLLVDETFREFAGTRSVVGTGRPHLFATGSFTKFYAADDLRVGFLVAPEEVAGDFARFHALVTNRLPPASVAGATRALEERNAVRRAVLDILRPNIAAARRAFPRRQPPDAPLLFDRPETGEHGNALAHRALAASVLVCPGAFFGDPNGVRISLTRRSFPDDLAAYLEVRSGSAATPRGPPKRPAAKGRPVRRPPGGSGRARAEPS